MSHQKKITPRVRENVGFNGKWRSLPINEYRPDTKGFFYKKKRGGGHNPGGISVQISDTNKGWYWIAEIVVSSPW